MTGCKINVAQPSGQDFEREIGLVGSRGAIEQAKRAIMDKVYAVVCSFHLKWKVTFLPFFTGREEPPGRRSWWW